MTAARIPDRVAAGAAFLDEHDPYWWAAGVPNAIELDTLWMSSTCSCVLGQRCPLEVLEASEYDQRYYAYALTISPFRAMEEVEAWARDLGFTLYRANGDDWNVLTAEWLRVISGRRAEEVS